MIIRRRRLKSFLCILQYVHQLLNPAYNHKNEYGYCSICGYFTKFSYKELLNEKSKEVQSCNWDKEFMENINISNSMKCSHCRSKFRVRIAAKCLLSYLCKDKIRSIQEFESNNYYNFKILETASKRGIFSGFDSNDKIIKSEYYDDIKRAEYKNGIRSEDLQNLSFEDNYFDCVIALDVFEHIPDPFKAFSEVKRVLKKGGIGIITVPIDERVPTTTTLADIKDGKINFYKSPSYHSDPLRNEGALVFTEFGLDIERRLKSEGYDIDFKKFSSLKYHGYQYVIIIKKS